MPALEHLFRESKGQPILFNGVEIKRIDRFPVRNGDILICSIEEATQKHEILQGFCIDVTGYAEVDGEKFKKGKGIRLHFWSGYCPKEVHIKVFTKLDNVVIYNVCETDVTYVTNDIDGSPIQKHIKTLDYGRNGAAMIVQEIDRGRRYRCSDICANEKPFPFNDIVFTVKKLTNSL